MLSFTKAQANSEIKVDLNLYFKTISTLMPFFKTGEDVPAPPPYISPPASVKRVKSAYENEAQKNEGFKLDNSV